jgi:hypothetical protein
LEEVQRYIVAGWEANPGNRERFSDAADLAMREVLEQPMT